MKAWSTFYPDVLVHVPGCPDILVDHALCRAAREFLKRTRTWTEWLDATAATAGTGVEYSFVLPAESALLRLERATINGNPLPVEGYRQRPSDWNIYPQGEQSLISADLVSFVLAGTFSAGDSVQVQASLIPSVAASGIPDHLADQHMEAIAEGAKAILLLTPNTTFLNPGLAAVANDRFESAIGIAGVDTFRSHTNNVPRARPKWF